MSAERDLKADFRWLLSGFDIVSRPDDLVFSHNDFQENNVLVRHLDKSTLTLIDFEYAAKNFRGYDLAAYVNECFLDYKYPKVPYYMLY
jgi:thiamine kinase-like enzyme